MPLVHSFTHVVQRELASGCLSASAFFCAAAKLLMKAPLWATVGTCPSFRTSFYRNSEHRRETNTSAEPLTARCRLQRNTRSHTLLLRLLQATKVGLTLGLTSAVRGRTRICVLDSVRHACIAHSTIILLLFHPLPPFVSPSLAAPLIFWSPVFCFRVPGASLQGRLKSTVAKTHARETHRS